MKNALPGIDPNKPQPSIPPVSECESNWEFIATTGKCYYFEPNSRTWPAALDNCQSMKADLV